MYTLPCDSKEKKNQSDLENNKIIIEINKIKLKRKVK